MTGKQRTAQSLLFLIAASLLSACAQAWPDARPANEHQDEAMVVAANPHAVEAGVEILREGGNATDAAIATMAVLGLVEPQSAGVGGGGLMLHYDARTHAITAYDGREMAPAGATPDMFMVSGQLMPFDQAQASGRSIGTPSLYAMLKMAHDEHGRLPWGQLFRPAIALADDGFAISPRMARLLAAAAHLHLAEDANARALYFDANGAPRPAGYVLRNPAYAATLRAIAAEGPDALTHGKIAEDIVAAARREPRAGTMTIADLQAYRPRRLEAVCGAFRVYRVCSSAPPGSGEAVVSILGLYARARPHPGGAENIDDWSAFIWASRLAYADRDHYVADPQFALVPAQAMVAPAYLDQRARLIHLAQAAPAYVDPGAPAGRDLYNRWGLESHDEAPGTTHVSIVDADGNAVAMTATVESLFGSQRMVDGFMLNNQLTDFTRNPVLNGRPVANAAAPGKRPRSSMSPTIVTDRAGHLVMVAGSPGSSAIIAYVARTIIGVLDWRQSPQDAVSTGNVVAQNGTVRVESARMSPAIAAGLRARGWTLQENAQEESGLHAILVTPHGLEGGADPRREGVVQRLIVP